MAKDGKISIGGLYKAGIDFMAEQAKSVVKTGAEVSGNVYDEIRKGVNSLNWETKYMEAEKLWKESLEKDDPRQRRDAEKMAHKLYSDSSLLGATSQQRKGKALILLSKCVTDKLEARQYAMLAMGIDNGDIKDEAKDQYDKLTKDITEGNFISTFKPAERQFLLFVSNERELPSCYDETKQINWIFTNSKYPHDISFPTRFPEPYTLYIAHPTLEGQYVKYEGSDKFLFDERSMVLARLLKGLGAKLITIKLNREETIAETSSIFTKIGLTLKTGEATYSGGHQHEGKNDSSSKDAKSITLSTECTPIAIEVPEDLKPWIEEDAQMRNLYKSRMDTNYTDTDHIVIDSDTLLELNAMQEDKVRASYKKMMISVNGSYNIKQENTFAKMQKTTLDISVVYATKAEMEKNKKALEMPKEEPIVTTHTDTDTDSEEEPKKETKPWYKKKFWS